MKLKLSDVVIDPALRPRVNDDADWQTTQRFADSMERGKVFPPITIWRRKNKNGDVENVLVDGLIRLKAAEIAKIGAILVDIQPFSCVREAFEFTVEVNSKHGRPLTPQDRTYCYNRLLELKSSKVTIERAIGMTVTKLENWRNSKAVITRAGMMVLKSPMVNPGACYDRDGKIKASMRNRIESKYKNDPEGLKAAMNPYHSGTQLGILRQAVSLFEFNIIAWKDRKVREKALLLHGLIGRKIAGK